MRYFEIREPYYALIKTKNEEECIRIYIENIADDDGTLKDELLELGKNTALGKYVNALNGDILLSEAIEHFNNPETDLLLIDGSLL